MADLDFGKLSHGNGCAARKFWNEHPELCAAHDYMTGDGSWYIIGKDGKRIQDDWDKPKPKIVGKLKEVKRDG